jgi:hypothetical protein
MHSLAFPFYAPTDVRPLMEVERHVLTKVLEGSAPQLLAFVPELQVVGRCGCGKCPTVFFQPHVEADQEHEIASYAGKDQGGGLVGVLVWEKNNRPSQLEFYSIDGHDSWNAPDPTTLEPF